MAEEVKKSTNVHDDLDDLLKEVADAHLPGYVGENERVDTETGAAEEDETAGMTAAQRKRRKKKNKKKEKIAEAKAAAANEASAKTNEQLLAESKKRHMTPLREKLGASL